MNEPKAARYQRLQRRARMASVGAGVLVWAVLALSPAAAWMAARLARLTGGWPTALAEIAAVVLIALAGAIAWQAVTLPIGLYFDAVLASRYASASAARDWHGQFLGRLQAAIAAVAAVTFAAIGWRLAVWAGGPWWWVVAAIAAAGLIVLALHAGPALVGSRRGATPVPAGTLRHRLAALASAAGVPVREFVVLPEGEGASAAALVTGIGAARRVCISSELVRDWRDEEVAVVVAHELAHHAHYDLWRASVLDAAVLAAAFGTSAWLASAIGPALGVGDPLGLSAFPLVLLASALGWVAATPLRYAQSRRHERRADRFALALTGEAAAFDTAIRRLGARRLAEERPGRLAQWLFQRHPSMTERLEVARAYRGGQH